MLAATGGATFSEVVTFKFAWQHTARASLCTLCPMPIRDDTSLLKV